MIGLLVWYIKYNTKKRKKMQEERLKQRVKEFTGQDFVKGYTTVRDLEKQYREKG
jgi:hypothetical protein